MTLLGNWDISLSDVEGYTETILNYHGEPVETHPVEEILRQAHHDISYYVVVYLEDSIKRYNS